MTAFSDVVSAVSPIILAALTAWQTRTQLQLKELKAKVAKLEANEAVLLDKLRAAVRTLRAWMARERNGNQGPPPELPKILEDEV